MQQGWVKLHISTLDNEVYKHDPTAWRLFEYLLLKAYKGVPQGRVVTTRDKIADALHGNSTTLYKALMRLKKANMVTTEGTRRFTTINIVKWHSYQGVSNSKSNTLVTSKGHLSNTLVLEAKILEPNYHDLQSQIRDVYDFYIQTFGKNQNLVKLTPGRIAKIRSRLSEFSADELKQATLNASRDEFYNGGGDRGWQGSLDYLFRTTENTEKYVHFQSGSVKKSIKEQYLETHK